MAVTNTPNNTGGGGYTCTKPPYPLPKTVDETKSNLRFFIEQANLKPENLGLALGKSRGYCASWVANISSKIAAIPPKYLAPVAELLHCDENLINPACPLLYKDKYIKYPPLMKGKTVYFCNESPKNEADYGKNLVYFLIRVGISKQEIQDATGISASTVRAMQRGEVFNEIKAMQFASMLDCPVELIYKLPSSTPISKLKNKQWKLINPPKSLDDVKNNLNFYVFASKRSMQRIADGIGISYDELRAALDPKTGVYIKDAQALKLANLLEIDPAPLLKSSFFFKTNFGKEHTLESNVSRVFDISNNDPIFNVPITTYASGGKATELAPSQCSETMATYLNLPSEASHLHGVCVIGDSMFNYQTGQGIQSGFCVMVDNRKRDIEEAIGRIVCIRLDGNELIVKRLERVDGKLFACSDNPDYNPHRLPLPENAELMGVCVSMYTDL